MGAVATAAATVVALWLGLRSPERARAADSIRETARHVGRQLDHWTVGLTRHAPRDRPELSRSEDRLDLSRLLTFADQLLPHRRWLVRRRLARIYGEDNVWFATMQPTETPDQAFVAVLFRSVSNGRRIDLVGSLLHRGMSAAIPEAAVVYELRQELRRLEQLR